MKLNNRFKRMFLYKEDDGSGRNSAKGIKTKSLTQMANEAAEKARQQAPAPASAAGMPSNVASQLNDASNNAVDETKSQENKKLENKANKQVESRYKEQETYDPAKHQIPMKEFHNWDTTTRKNTSLNLDTYEKYKAKRDEIDKLPDDKKWELWQEWKTGGNPGAKLSPEAIVFGNMVNAGYKEPKPSVSYEGLSEEEKLNKLTEEFGEEVAKDLIAKEKARTDLGNIDDFAQSQRNWDNKSEEEKAALLEQMKSNPTSQAILFKDRGSPAPKKEEEVKKEEVVEEPKPEEDPKPEEGEKPWEPSTDFSSMLKNKFKKANPLMFPSIYNSWKSGLFGDPDSPEAKSTFTSYLIDHIGKTLGNTPSFHAVGNRVDTTKAEDLGGKKSKWDDKVMDEELKRWNEQQDNISDAYNEVVKENITKLGGINNDEQALAYLESLNTRDPEKLRKIFRKAQEFKYGDGTITAGDIAFAKDPNYYVDLFKSIAQTDYDKKKFDTAYQELLNKAKEIENSELRKKIEAEINQIYANTRSTNAAAKNQEIRNETQKTRDIIEAGSNIANAGSNAINAVGNALKLGGS